MYTLENIAYAYPGNPETLRGMSVTLSGGVTLLAGPNAGGKTTLLTVLAGLLIPQSGSIAETETGRRLSSADLRQMARMVMQDAEAQILGARVEEDIRLGRAASTLGNRFDAEATELACRLGLAPYLKQSVEALSHGQKRKLCLLHALAAGPCILLLDEPFAGLDFPSARELRGFIREKREAGLTQVISVHDLEPLIDIADHLVIIQGGVAVAEGKPLDLADRLPEWSVRPPGGGWD